MLLLETIPNIRVEISSLVHMVMLQKRSAMKLHIAVVGIEKSEKVFR
jgi:hypothetical protein